MALRLKAHTADAAMLFLNVRDGNERKNRLKEKGQTEPVLEEKQDIGKGQKSPIKVWFAFVGLPLNVCTALINHCQQ